MRSYARFFLLLFAVATALSQSAVAVVKITGLIKNKQADSLTVSYNSNRLAYYPVNSSGVLDAGGNFSLSLVMTTQRDEYIQAEIRHGDHITEIFIKDGDSLVLSADAVRFDSSLNYSGRGSEVQNFVVHHVLVRGRLNQYTTRMKNSMGLSAALFSKAIAAERNEEVNFLEKNGGDLPSSFRTFWLAHFSYYNYFFLQQYPFMHTAMALRRYTDTIPDSCYAVIKDMPLSFDDKMLNVPPYLLYLSGVFESRLKAAHFAFPVSEPRNAGLFIDSVNKLAYKSLPDKSAEYFVAQSLYARVRHQPTDLTKQELQKFRRRWARSEYLPLLEKQLAIAERLTAGQPAPDLALVDDSGSRMQLSDLKGKVVYLSFWSTQCRQCVSEMRADHRIKDVFINKPVVFAYVSIDEDSTIGQKLVKQFHLSGPFSWTTGGWYSREAMEYGVQGMPAHFLIDREGNFAMQNAPSPAQKTELIVAISRLF